MAVKNLPMVMILFGATGDLAHRKLYPAMYQLYKQGLIHDRFAVIATARRPWSDDYLREQISDAVHEAAPDEEQNAELLHDFASHFYYQSHDVTQTDHYKILKQKADQLSEKYQAHGNRIFYLAMAPRFFGMIAEHIYDQHLLGDGFNRLIIEKPFGRDLPSATKLNNQIAQSFAEKDVYRIDHYLGKEMIQNILPFRLANPLIRNIWNSKSIKNVQITLAESLGVEARGGYYDTSGALRDMVQNHIFQIITLLAMPEPSELSSDAIHEAKKQLWDSVVFPSSAMVARNYTRGQYLASGSTFGYLDEPNVNPESTTETFAAGEVKFLGGPLAQVPFYFRTGKRLREKVSRIDIVLKDMTNLYGQAASDSISVVIDPNMRFFITINGKKIRGQGLRSEDLDYLFTPEEIKSVPDGYERLLHDAFVEDHTYFSRWSELEKFWEYIDTVEDAWLSQNAQGVEIPQYQPFKLGPKESGEIFEDPSDHWIYS